MGGWDRRLGGDPGEQVGVAFFDQGFEPIELAIVKIGHVPFGEASEHELDFARSAVARAKEQSFSANVQGHDYFRSRVCATLSCF